MPINYVRVVNQQTIVRSILIDKIDRSQGNFSGYAQRAKQKVYVPYVNPIDTSVKGYIDLVPTDEVLLSADAGTIKKLATAGRTTTAVVSSALVATSAVTSAVHGGAVTTIGGTIFLSVTPDLTYVTFTNLVGATQRVAQGSFSVLTAISIVVPDAAVTIGTPGVGWKVQVLANSKLSNQFTL
jgi:hypothetical protein